MLNLAAYDLWLQGGGSIKSTTDFADNYLIEYCEKAKAL